MVIDKKQIRYTLLIMLAIASTPISIEAMETEEQSKNKNKINYVDPNEWNNQNSSSESDNSDLEENLNLKDNTFFGNLDNNNNNNNTNDNFISGEKRPSEFTGFKEKPNSTTQNAANNIFNFLQPDKKVHGSFSFPFRRFIFVSGVIASVIALTQIYKQKQQNEKIDKDHRQTKRPQRETPASENRSRASNS